MSAPTPTWRRLGRRPGLDGVRGVAILLVMGCHMLSQNLTDGRFHTVGSAGVVVFFTLSGFLITCLLMEEMAGRGRIAFATFFRNRALRLFPALAVALVLVGSFQTAIGWGRPAILPVVLYYSNWATVLHQPLNLNVPTWSLSIEEQFYLGWPLLLLLVRRWRYGAMVAVLAGILASTVLRLVLAGGEDGLTRVYYGSDTMASTLLVGCLLALLAHRGTRVPSPRWLVPVGSVVLALLFLVRHDSWGDVWVPTLVPWLTAGMIWSAAHHRTFLEWAPLRYLGRRSYGIYLWHNALVWFALALTGPSLLAGTVALALALVIAELSFRLVERPFLKRKRSRHDPEAGGEPPPWVLPGAIADPLGATSSQAAGVRRDTLQS